MVERTPVKKKKIVRTPVKKRSVRKPLEAELMDLLDKRIREAPSFAGKGMPSKVDDGEAGEDLGEGDLERGARMDVVSDFLHEAKGLLDDRFRKKIAKTNGVSIFRKPGEMFPDQKPWLKNDAAIAENLSRYPFFYPLLNFIYNETRFPKDDIDKIEKLAGGKRHEYTDGKGKKQRRIYSAFRVNKEFYEKVRKKVFVKEGNRKRFMTKPTAKKYLKAMLDAGIIVLLANEGKYGRICADGYYTKFDGKWAKKTLLKKTPASKKALKELAVKFNSKKS